MDRLIIIGYLGRDAELRYTPDGRQICQFSVAATRKWKSKEGEAHERTNWYRCMLWGKRGEALTPYLAKGTRVSIIGRLNGDEHGGPRLWQAEDGSARASYEVMVEELELLGGGSGHSATPKAAAGENDFADIDFVDF